ncbi:MAG: iron ABC transporter permease, partial [Chloroflexota bacterium]
MIRYRLLPILATAVCIFAALPLVYIVYHASQADPALWERLTSTQLPTLIQNTVLLVLCVSGLTTVFGVLAAWLVERTDLPGRQVWRWLLALPLAIPGYVMAVIYMFLLRRGGFIDQMGMTYLGFERQQLPLPPLFSLGGVSTVISLYAYPLVFLAVAAALRVQDATLEEAARVSGHNPRQIFFRLTLPLVLPAAAGGVLLVGLYTLSDFGTVALMRYQTFTTAIFRQFAGEIGRAAASIVSLGLIALSLPLLLGENFLYRSGQRYVRSGRWRPIQPVQLGRWRWLATAYIGLLATLSIFVPVLVLVGLTLQGIIAPTQVDRIWRIRLDSLWQAGGNSVFLGLAGASVVLVLGLFPAIFTVRNANAYSRTLAWISKTAFALPGIIVGLGFLMFFIRTPIYATTTALGLALAFRLLPQTVTLNEATLRLVSPTLEQAARTMGHGPWATLRRVTVPLAA